LLERREFERGHAHALAATRVLRNVLYAASPSEPATLIIASLVLVAISVVAIDVPARRAARMDPMVPLRNE